jgi:hypothetical protein
MALKAAGASTSGMPPTTSSNSNATVFNDLLVKALEATDARLNELSKASDVQAKQSKLPAVEAALKEAQQMKKSFVMEISLMKPAEKAPFRTVQENYEAHLLKIEQTLKVEKAWLEKSLVTGGKNDKRAGANAAMDPNDAHDQLLKQTMNIQGKMGESLVRTRQRAAETVHIGREVADALEGQKDTIIRIDQGVTDVDDEIKRANQILAAIFRRMATDKLVICCSFIMFSLIIVVIALVSTGTIATGRRLR